MKYSETFLKAVSVLKAYPKPELHTAMVAQWILESNRGFSLLARHFLNLAGMKWREELEDVAKPRQIAVPSEIKPTYFAYFSTIEDFVKGFFLFLNRPIYRGWNELKTPEEYIEFIGYRWAADPEYIQKVKALFKEAEELLMDEPKGEPTWFELYKNKQGGGTAVAYTKSTPLFLIPFKDTEDLSKLFMLYGKHNIEVAPRDKIMPLVQAIPIIDDEPKKEPGTSETFPKPTVIRKPTPNQSARNGAQITQIVMHYTTTRSAESTISWFANPKARVSAHYLIARDGIIYQFVDDDRKAWHAAGHNANSIGIEHSAADGDKLTEAQEKASIALCRWLMAEYKIPKARVTGHKFLPYGTSCPGHIFGEPTEKALKDWVDKYL